MNQSSLSTVPEKRNLLTLQDYRTLGLASLGGTLEFYDFIIFIFFANVLSRLFFPPEMPEWLRLLQTFSIFAAGNLARPIGGIVMAHFGDMLGRKRMFTLSIFLMVLPTLGMGLLPGYTVIGIWAPILMLILRIVQGIAIGGEIPGAWVFVSEHVPTHRIGYACSVLAAGLVCGILLGSLIATFINRIFTPDQIIGWAWRLPFLLGALFGLIAVYLRKWLQETPVFLKMQAEKKLATEWPLKTVFKQHRHAAIISILLTWILAASVVVIILMTPTYLQQQFHISANIALQANSLAICALIIGCITAGYMIDRLGNGWTFISWSSLLGITSTYFYYTIAYDASQLYLLYSIVGFSVGIAGAIPSAIVRAFPPAIRFSGLSFAYNISYAIFGGLTPIIIAWWLKSNPMAHAHYIIGIAILGITIGLYFLFSQQQFKKPISSLKSD